MGKVPMHLGCTTERVEVKDGRAHLHLRASDGSRRELITEHVIAATGYKVNLDRLRFLSREIRAQLRVVGGSPVLSRKFESSIPGLYFSGITAANSFGPVMRFAFGAGFAARTITRALSSSAAQTSVAVSATRDELREIELREIEVPDAREKAGAVSTGSRG
jgi:thioredoxin reductase